MTGGRGALPFLLTVAAYGVASLWPFEPWHFEPPRNLVDGVARSTDGGVLLGGMGAVTTGKPPAWLRLAIREQALKLRRRVRTAGPDQHGPARLLSIAPDPFLRNLTLGQPGADLALRVRADGMTGGTALPDGAANFLVPGVFGTARWVDVALEVGPGKLRLRVDGALRVDETLHATPLNSWSDQFPLTIGNESALDRPWRGAVRDAVVHVAGADYDLLTADAVEGAPGTFWFRGHASETVPFAERNIEDEVLNLLGYIPPGLLLGIALRRRLALWPRLLVGAAVIAVFSASMEFLQLAVQPRHPSVTDLALDTFGGAIGIALAAALPAAGVAPQAIAAKMGATQERATRTRGRR